MAFTSTSRVGDSGAPPWFDHDRDDGAPNRGAGSCDARGGLLCWASARRSPVVGVTKSLAKQDLDGEHAECTVLSRSRSWLLPRPH